MLRIIQLQEEHPYLVSFAMSMAIAVFTLFFTAPIYVVDTPEPTDMLQFVNIDTVSAPRRVVKRQLSTTAGETVDTASPDRAIGTVDDANAVDIAFFPNIVPPRPVGKLRRIYPQSAREMNLEATLNVELLVAPDGRVKRVQIIGIRLSKDLPPESYGRLVKDFSRAAVQILLGAQFTPPIVQGKKVPIKMELPLKFRLDSPV